MSDEQSDGHFVNSVYSVRRWKSSSDQLTGPYTYSPWKKGQPEKALCNKSYGSISSVQDCVNHQAPALDCSCGIYGMHSWGWLKDYGMASDRSWLWHWACLYVFGICEHWGNCQLHSSGIRSQYARPKVLISPLWILKKPDLWISLMINLSLLGLFFVSSGNWEYFIAGLLMINILAWRDCLAIMFCLRKHFKLKGLARSYGVKIVSKDKALSMLETQNLHQVASDIQEPSEDSYQIERNKIYHPDNKIKFIKVKQILQGQTRFKLYSRLGYFNFLSPKITISINHSQAENILDINQLGKESTPMSFNLKWNADIYRSYDSDLVDFGLVFAPMGLMMTLIALSAGVSGIYAQFLAFIAALLVGLGIYAWFNYRLQKMQAELKLKLPICFKVSNTF